MAFSNSKKPSSKANYLSYLPLISSSYLFEGATIENVKAMLNCLSPRVQTFSKGSFVMGERQETQNVAMLLEGSVFAVQGDVLGNRHIVERFECGQCMALAYACAANAKLNMGLQAQCMSTVMFLNTKRVLTLCPQACKHHAKLVQNLVSELAQKNLALNEKLTCISQRTTRGKIVSYLSSVMQRKGSNEFDIPFTRQQMADYLGVDRSGLSIELSKMQSEGLLKFKKSHFVLDGGMG